MSASVGIPSTDSGIVIDAGPVPEIDLSGDADPALAAEDEQNAASEIAGARADADDASREDFGELDVAPTLRPRKLRATTQLKAPPTAGRKGEAPGRTTGVPADLLARFDAVGAARLAVQVGGHAAGYAIKQADYESASQDAQRASQRQIEQATTTTRAQQDAMRTAVRDDVAGERTRWQQENARLERRFGEQASPRRQALERDVDLKVTTTRDEAADTLATAERDATAEKDRAEGEARKEADKAKAAEPQGFWDQAKGVVSDVFDAARSAVTWIFDRLREAVDTIIEGAKRAVSTLIETARTAIVTLIEGFGEFVKGVLSELLVKFPEAAEGARRWIDSRVEQAVGLVNGAAVALEQHVLAALDFLAVTLDNALSSLQNTLLAVLDGLEMLALGVLNALAFLQRLAAWLAEKKSILDALEDLQAMATAALEAMKVAIGEMIESAIDAAKRGVDEVSAQLGPRGRKHLAGIWRHLEAAMSYLRDNWWTVIKEAFWTMLWPLPEVWEAVPLLLGSIADCWIAAANGDLSGALDAFLGTVTTLNDILGNLYGWFAIASILAGGIIGAFFGGVGAIPGVMAGAAFAATAGEVLDMAGMATDLDIVLKSTADLVIGNDNEEEDEKDYENIAGSGLSLALVVAMAPIPAIGGRLAKRIKASFPRPKKPPRIKPDLPGPDGPRPDGPMPDGPTPDGPTPDGPTPDGPASDARALDGATPGTPDEPGLVDQWPSVDGHTVKLLDDGRIFICSRCTEIRLEYERELWLNPDLRRQLDEADAMPSTDPEARSRAIADVEAKLAAERTRLAQLDPKDILAGLAARHVDPNSARKVADLAVALDTKHPGLLERVHLLATHPRMQNPQKLRELLDAVRGDPNIVLELNLAAERVTGGATVQLGAVAGIGADVVDHTAEEAIQLKNVTGGGDKVEERLIEAANQLAGRGAKGRLEPGDPNTEVPPMRPDGRPYTRTAEIHIGKGNKLFDADRATVEEYVRSSLQSTANKGSVDQVRIHNNHRDSPFTIIGPF